jgi:hypothetical protein
MNSKLKCPKILFRRISNKKEKWQLCKNIKWISSRTLLREGLQNGCPANNCSLGIRQINCLIQKFKKEGSSDFIHKNTGRISPREIDKDIRDTILKLRVEQYEDYNIQHFQEKLVEKHNKTDLCINELEDALKVLFGKISNVKAIIICKNIK